MGAPRRVGSFEREGREALGAVLCVAGAGLFWKCAVIEWMRHGKACPQGVGGTGVPYRYGAKAKEFVQDSQFEWGKIWQSVSFP